MEAFFGLLAGVVGLVGYGPYVRDILRHKTRPDRASWLIWTLEYGGLFVTQLASGARDSLWLIGLQLLGALVVYGLSLRYGMGTFQRKKQVLLAGVCLTLVGWFLTKNAGMAIMLLVAIEAAGVALTARKTYLHPGTETLTLWWLTGIAGALGIAAVKPGAAGILYVYPIALVCMCLGVIAAAFLGARNKQASAVPVDEL